MIKAKKDKKKLEKMMKIKKHDIEKVKYDKEIFNK
jgi:hypothetical protein